MKLGKHSFKEWLAATRYWSFPVSTMPVTVTFAWLVSKGLLPSGYMPFVVLILSLVGVMLLHAGGNVLSDLADYRSGVDNPDAFAVGNLVFGHFREREYLVFGILLLATGVVVGIAITLLSGPGLLWIGGAGVLFTIAYPWLKYHALGDADIFLVFGILPVIGTAYAVTGSFHPEALILSVPVGIITVSVLHANNTYDTESDRKAGIKTFGMILGLKVSAILYCAYMIVPFVSIASSVATGLLHPLSLLCLVAIPAAWKNLKQAAHYKELGLEAMKGLDQASAKLQLVFSLPLAFGLIMAGLL